MSYSLRAYRIALTITLLCCSSALAKPTWEKIHNEEGVTVYQRESSLDLRTSKQNKSSAFLFDIIAVIRDVDRREEWVFRCKDSRVVKGYTDFEVSS